MSVTEVAHRSWRVVRHAAERALAISPRVPEPMAHWTGPREFYFKPGEGPPVALEDAQRLCAGLRPVLGLGWIKLPASPWHIEPATHGVWPLIDSARVMSTAPDGFDARLTWQFNRGHEWCILARAYSITNDAQFLRRLENDIESWLAANPIGTGINWASAMEVAIRIHSFFWIAGMLEPGCRLIPTLGCAIYEHAWFLKRHLSRFSSANNHLVVELSGLIIAATAFGDSRSRQRYSSELRTALAQQVYPDGVHAEMATHYHAFVLEAVLLVVYLDRERGHRDPALDAIVTKMATYLAALTLPDGSVLRQGDDDDGGIIPFISQDYATRLIAAAYALEDSTSKLLTPARPPPPRESLVFRSSGQVVLRSSSLVATFDAGPFGFGTLAAHAHCDALAVNLAIGGRRFLVDRGTCTYNGDASVRDRFRFTAAHNTVQISNSEQGTPAGPFLWASQPPVSISRCELGITSDIIEAFHDGFAPHRHRRTLVRHGELLLIVDSIEGPTASAVARYHFAPGVRIDTLQRSFRMMHDGIEGWLRVLTADSLSLVETRHSDVYASSVTASSLECRFEDDHHACVLGAVEPAGKALEQLAERCAKAGVPEHVLLLLRA